jgi:4-amino-4-deoxy-L-arabinose transferase-like glycosyltransferase
MQKRKFVYIVILIAVFVLGIVLRLADLEVSQRTPDEILYKAYGKDVAERGVSVTKELVRYYNDNENLWIYPTPVRIGYIYLGAAVMKLTGSMEVDALVYLSLAASILTLLILILMGLRFFNPFITAVALLFMAVSPMDLTIVRRAWQDGVVGLVSVLLVYCCCEISRKNNRKIWFILFAVIGAWLVLIKESGIIIFGLCGIWVLWGLIREKDLKNSLYFIGLSFLSVGASIIFLSKVSGGISGVIQATINNIASTKTNVYGIEYNSGPWYRIIQGLFLVSPAATILSFLGIFVIVKERQRVFLGIVFFLITYVIISMIPPYMKNLRYLSVIYVLFYLMSGLGCWYIVMLLKSIFKKKVFFMMSSIVCLIISVSAFYDYKNYKHIFIKVGVSDLACRYLLENSIYRWK